MPCWICITCGAQFPESAEPPAECAICEDERQYVGLDGQKWSTPEQLGTQFRNRIEPEEPGLTSFHIDAEGGKKFGIGQRAFLLEAPGGNVLWDCIALLDDATRRYIRDRGGLSAIAISHPHYYTAMVDWSRSFGDAPVWLHEADRQWVMRPDERIRFWSGDAHALNNGLTLIRCGGHFPGGTVLHWPAGAAGRGALLSGDIVQVVPDRRWVGFMYSYPNYIPLGATTVRRIAAAVEPYEFDRIYGAFPRMTVEQDGRAAIRRSAERHIRFITD
jgi:glyoxylase-like metal-dependent hydrolase (beta-lactamase superfamily II)